MARGALSRLGAVHARGLSASSVHGRPGYWSSLGVLGEDGMVLSAAANDDPSAKYGFTFSRASTGTYIGASGLLETAASGVQRRQIDPVTGHAFWLHEQQSTNLVPNTTTEYATTGGVSTTTIQADPFGATGAVLFTCLAGVSSHFAACSGVAYTAGTTYTLSKWVKEGTALRVQIAGPSAVFTTLDEYANFLLTGNGSVTAQGAGAIAAGIDPPVNGYRRCWITAVADVTSASAGGPVSFLLSTGLEARGPSVEGGGLTFTVFGSQVEAGPLSSYIVPAGASTTRSQDQILFTGSAGRTNWVKNSTGVGGTASALPTGWSVNTTSTAGVAATVIGTGTDATYGAYWDVRFQGTITAAGDILIAIGAPTDIAAVISQTWTGSVALALVGGGWPAGRSPRLGLTEYTSASVYVGGSTSFITINSGLERLSISRVTTGATTAGIRLSWTIQNLQIGDVVDFTIRIAAPQMEKAASASAYIPTSGYARTVENIASWWNNDEGTFVWRGRVAGTTSTKYPALVGVGNGSSGSHEHVVYVTATTNVIRAEAKNAGVVTLTSAPAGGVTIGADFVASYAYGADYALAVRSGVAGSVDSSGALPAGIDRIAIGGYQYRGGTPDGSLLIASIEYYPRKLSAAEQLALTV